MAGENKSVVVSNNRFGKAELLNALGYLAYLLLGMGVHISRVRAQLANRDLVDLTDGHVASPGNGGSQRTRSHRCDGGAIDSLYRVRTVTPP
jgi:hypothetical protein